MTVLRSAVRLPAVFWNWLRAVSGDDAYDRYLDHWRIHQANEDGADNGPPLGRREFFRQRESERWNGVRRCC